MDLQGGVDVVAGVCHAVGLALGPAASAVAQVAGGLDGLRVVAARQEAAVVIDEAARPPPAPVRRAAGVVSLIGNVRRRHGFPAPRRLALPYQIGGSRARRMTV